MPLITAMGIDEVVDRMRVHDRVLHVDGDPRRHFHGTYLRTTLAVRAGLATGRFVDADWVERWAVQFARYYLDALGPAPADVWLSAFREGPLTPRQRVLLGMHTHISHDFRSPCSTSWRTTSSMTRGPAIGAGVTTTPSTGCSPSGWHPSCGTSASGQRRPPA